MGVVNGSRITRILLVIVTAGLCYGSHLSGNGTATGTGSTRGTPRLLGFIIPGRNGGRPQLQLIPVSGISSHLAGLRRVPFNARSLVDAASRARGRTRGQGRTGPSRTPNIMLVRPQSSRNGVGGLTPDQIRRLRLAASRRRASIGTTRTMSRNQTQSRTSSRTQSRSPSMTSQTRRTMLPRQRTRARNQVQSQTSSRTQSRTPGLTSQTGRTMSPRQLTRAELLSNIRRRIIAMNAARNRAGISRNRVATSRTGSQRLPTGAATSPTILPTRRVDEAVLSSNVLPASSNTIISATESRTQSTSSSSSTSSQSTSTVQVGSQTGSQAGTGTGRGLVGTQHLDIAKPIIQEAAATQAGASPAQELRFRSALPNSSGAAALPGQGIAAAGVDGFPTLEIGPRFNFVSNDMSGQSNVNSRVMGTTPILGMAVPTSPARTAPIQTFTSQSLSSQTIPTQSSPTQAGTNQPPFQTFPPQLGLDQTVSSQFIPSPTIPGQLLPDQTLPTHIFLDQPIQPNLPVPTIPTILGKHMLGQQVSTQTFGDQPIQTNQDQITFGQAMSDLSISALPAQVTPLEPAVTQTQPTNMLSTSSLFMDPGAATLPVDTLKSTSHLRPIEPFWPEPKLSQSIPASSISDMLLTGGFPDQFMLPGGTVTGQSVQDVLFPDQSVFQPNGQLPLGPFPDSQQSIGASSTQGDSSTGAVPDTGISNMIDAAFRMDTSVGGTGTANTLTGDLSGAPMVDQVSAMGSPTGDFNMSPSTGLAASVNDGMGPVFSGTGAVGSSAVDNSAGQVSSISNDNTGSIGQFVASAGINGENILPAIGGTSTGVGGLFDQSSGSLLQDGVAFGQPSMSTMQEGGAFEQPSIFTMQGGGASFGQPSVSTLQGGGAFAQPSESVLQGGGAFEQPSMFTMQGGGASFGKPSVSTLHGGGAFAQPSESAVQGGGAFEQPSMSTMQGSGAFEQQSVSTVQRGGAFEQPSESVLQGGGAFEQPSMFTMQGGGASFGKPSVSTLHGGGAFAQPSESAVQGGGAFEQPSMSTMQGSGAFEQQSVSTVQRGGPIEQPSESVLQGGGAFEQPVLSTIQGDGAFDQSSVSTTQGGETFGQPPFSTVQGGGAFEPSLSTLQGGGAVENPSMSDVQGGGAFEPPVSTMQGGGVLEQLLHSLSTVQGGGAFGQPSVSDVQGGGASEQPFVTTVHGGGAGNAEGWTDSSASRTPFTEASTIDVIPAVPGVFGESSNNTESLTTGAHTRNIGIMTDENLLRAMVTDVLKHLLASSLDSAVATAGAYDISGIARAILSAENAPVTKSKEIIGTKTPNAGGIESTASTEFQGISDITSANTIHPILPSTPIAHDTAKFPEQIRPVEMNAATYSHSLYDVIAPSSLENKLLSETLTNDTTTNRSLMQATHIPLPDFTINKSSVIGDWSDPNMTLPTAQLPGTGINTNTRDVVFQKATPGPMPFNMPPPPPVPVGAILGNTTDINTMANDNLTGITGSVTNELTSSTGVWPGATPKDEFRNNSRADHASIQNTQRGVMDVNSTLEIVDRNTISGVPANTGSRLEQDFSATLTPRTGVSITPEGLMPGPPFENKFSSAALENKLFDASGLRAKPVRNMLHTDGPNRLGALGSVDASLLNHITGSTQGNVSPVGNEIRALRQPLSLGQMIMSNLPIPHDLQTFLSPDKAAVDTSIASTNVQAGTRLTDTVSGISGTSGGQPQMDGLNTASEPSMFSDMITFAPDETGRVTVFNPITNSFEPIPLADPFKPGGFQYDVAPAPIVDSQPSITMFTRHTNTATETAGANTAASSTPPEDVNSVGFFPSVPASTGSGPPRDVLSTINVLINQPAPPPSIPQVGGSVAGFSTEGSVMSTLRDIANFNIAAGSQTNRPIDSTPFQYNANLGQRGTSSEQTNTNLQLDSSVLGAAPPGYIPGLTTNSQKNLGGNFIDQSTLLSMLSNQVSDQVSDASVQQTPVDLPPPPPIFPGIPDPAMDISAQFGMPRGHRVFLPDLSPDTTSADNQSPDMTSTVDQLPDIASTMGQPPDMTSKVNQLPDITSSINKFPDITSSNNQFPDTTSSINQSPDVTSSNNQSPDTTASNNQFPDITSSNNQFPDITSSINHSPDIISPNNQFPDITSSTNHLPDITSSNNQLPDITSSNNQSPDITSSHNQFPDITSAVSHSPDIATVVNQSPEITGPFIDTFPAVDTAVPSDITFGSTIDSHIDFTSTFNQPIEFINPNTPTTATDSTGTGTGGSPRDPVSHDPLADNPNWAIFDPASINDHINFTDIYVDIPVDPTADISSINTNDVVFTNTLTQEPTVIPPDRTISESSAPLSSDVSAGVNSYTKMQDNPMLNIIPDSTSHHETSRPVKPTGAVDQFNEVVINQLPFS